MYISYTDLGLNYYFEFNYKIRNLYTEGKLMDRRAMKKIIVEMTELVILILVEVLANYLTFTSFNPSSLPINFPHHTKLNNVPNLSHKCVEEEVVNCITSLKIPHKHRNAICIIRCFRICMVNPIFKNDPAYHTAKSCYVACINTKTEGILFANCLLRCYRELVFSAISLSLLAINTFGRSNTFKLNLFENGTRIMLLASGLCRWDCSLGLIY